MTDDKSGQSVASTDENLPYSRGSAEDVIDGKVRVRDAVASDAPTALDPASTRRRFSMTRFFLRILISVVIGWMIGVQAALTFGPEGNLTPMLYIFVTVPLTYAGSFLIVPLLSNWLDRLR